MALTHVHMIYIRYLCVIDDIYGGRDRGHFEGKRVGSPSLLLKSCRNAWKRRSRC